jgi:hypothetical protein
LDTAGGWRLIFATLQDRWLLEHHVCGSEREASMRG